MRDGNCFYFFGIVPAWVGLKPTYEGWKRWVTWEDFITAEKFEAYL